MDIGKKKAWIFHGDIFDVTMQHSKWLARLGAIGYDSLILINTLVNWFLTRLGREKMSLSKRIKGSIKNAVKFINDFEVTASELAIEKGYQYVICGHIHHPDIREIRTMKGSVTYLNSGDWVENLSALEFHKGEWSIYKHLESDPSLFHLTNQEEDLESSLMKDKLDVRKLLDLLKAE